jgi:hypothetical protein
LACLAFAAAIWPSLAHAQSGPLADLLGPEAWDVHIDARASVAGGEQSWLDGGYGKLRYGGDADGDTQVRARIAEADIAWKPRFTWNLTGLVSGKYQDGQSNDFDLSEAYLEYRSNPAPTRVSLRAGLMWPPVSEEHSGSNWTVEDTITPSAANSWIGEEVKVLGLEGSVEHQFSEHEVKLTAAVFRHDDMAGTLLAYRGWALQDLTVTLHGDMPLPPLAPSVQPYQATITTPFLEFDGRTGYYARLDWRPPLPFTLNVFRYDNEGDRVSSWRKQTSWRTRFWNVGAMATLGPRTTAKAQFMWGNTLVGADTPMGIPVDVDFAAGYVLVGQQLGGGKLSLRGDWFKTTDNSFVATNDNNEHGWAALAAYKMPLAKHVEGVIELLHVWSYRDGRELYGGLDEDQSQTQLQFSLRLDF